LWRPASAALGESVTNWQGRAPGRGAARNALV